jgi:hypothetical protein
MFNKSLLFHTDTFYYSTSCGCGTRMVSESYKQGNLYQMTAYQVEVKRRRKFKDHLLKLYIKNEAKRVVPARSAQPALFATHHRYADRWVASNWDILIIST